MNEFKVLINVQAGPIDLTFESNSEDILHHISISEFTQKVLALTNYVGPADNPPVLPVLPVADLVVTEDRFTGPVDKDALIQAAADAHKKTPSPEPVEEDDDDDDDTYTTMAGEKVTQKSLFKTKDKILAAALEEEGIVGWNQ